MKDENHNTHIPEFFHVRAWEILDGKNTLAIKSPNFSTADEAKYYLIKHSHELNDTAGVYQTNLLR